eukprot:TRINITY_DN8655_c0_g1_i1.p1 TRINITY_DN8655_c0_g1~~TRINITY_DN8655_c0_g1_i1.p1  ORF type:complete len:715 (+),score=196.21 TRINITY_DN8655_c0_g1_i1:184-2328(+)
MSFQEKHLKIVFCGPSGVGKSSLIKRYMQPSAPFSPTYNPTAIENISGSVKADKYLIRMDVLDCGGKIISVIDSMDLKNKLFSNADIFFLCFSVDNMVSLQEVINEWSKIIVPFTENAALFLVACKSDMLEQEDELGVHVPMEFLNDLSFLPCSSLTNEGIKEVFFEAFRWGIEKWTNPTPEETKFLEDLEKDIDVDEIFDSDENTRLFKQYLKDQHPSMMSYLTLDRTLQIVDLLLLGDASTLPKSSKISNIITLNFRVLEKLLFEPQVMEKLFCYFKSDIDQARGHIVSRIVQLMFHSNAEEVLDYIYENSVIELLIGVTGCGIDLLQSILTEEKNYIEQSLGEGEDPEGKYRILEAEGIIPIIIEKITDDIEDVLPVIQLFEHIRQTRGDKCAILDNTLRYDSSSFVDKLFKSLPNSVTQVTQKFVQLAFPLFSISVDLDVRSNFRNAVLSNKESILDVMNSENKMDVYQGLVLCEGLMEYEVLTGDTPDVDFFTDLIKICVDTFFKYPLGSIFHVIVVSMFKIIFSDENAWLQKILLDDEEFVNKIFDVEILGDYKIHLKNIYEIIANSEIIIEAGSLESFLSDKGLSLLIPIKVEPVNFAIEEEEFDDVMYPLILPEGEREDQTDSIAEIDDEALDREDKVGLNDIINESDIPVQLDETPDAEVVENIDDVEDIVEYTDDVEDIVEEVDDILDIDTQNIEDAEDEINIE